MVFEKYTPSQMKILKRLNSREFEIIHDSDETYRFLFRQGVIRCGYRHDLPNSPYCASITEDGKRYLSAYHSNFKRFFIPICISTFLSVSAIIISIIALLQSAQ